MKAGSAGDVMRVDDGDRVASDVTRLPSSSNFGAWPNVPPPLPPSLSLSLHFLPAASIFPLKKASLSPLYAMLLLMTVGPASTMAYEGDVNAPHVKGFGKLGRW